MEMAEVNKIEQTALEWFVEEMFKQGYFNDKPMTVANINYFANIAKEMEAKQRQEDTNHGYSQGYDDGAQGKEPMQPEIFTLKEQSYQDKMRDKITKAKSRLK
jgi:hypothetical protein